MLKISYRITIRRRPRSKYNKVGIYRIGDRMPLDMSPITVLGIYSSYLLRDKQSYNLSVKSSYTIEVTLYYYVPSCHF